MRIQSDGLYPLNYTSAYSGVSDSRLVLASGHLSTATATIGYLDDQGDFTPFKGRTFLLDSRMEILHGVGIIPYLKVIGSSSAFDLRLWVTGSTNGSGSNTSGNGNGTGVDDKNFRHTQAIPLASWVINHGLGKHPSVTITDPMGLEVVAQVAHSDDNNVTITFSTPFAGVADLN